MHACDSGLPYLSPSLYFPSSFQSSSLQLQGSPPVSQSSPREPRPGNLMDQYANLPLAEPARHHHQSQNQNQRDRHQHYQPSSTTFGVQEPVMSRNEQVYGSLRQYSHPQEHRHQPQARTTLIQV